MGQLALYSDCRWPVLDSVWIPLKNEGQIAKDIFDTFERLIELSERVNFCLGRFSVYMDVFDLTGLLGNRLTLFYREIITFCLKAAEVYNRGKASEYLDGKDHTTDLRFGLQKP